MTTPLTSLTELRNNADAVRVGDWTLERWPNGIIFLESPSGEGTQLDEGIVVTVLARLFLEHF